MWGFSTPTPLIIWVQSPCPFFLVCGVWRKWKRPCMQGSFAWVRNEQWGSRVWWVAMHGASCTWERVGMSWKWVLVGKMGLMGIWKMGTRCRERSGYEEVAMFAWLAWMHGASCKCGEWRKWMNGGCMGGYEGWGGWYEHGYGDGSGIPVCTSGKWVWMVGRMVRGMSELGIGRWSYRWWVKLWVER